MSAFTAAPRHSSNCVCLCARLAHKLSFIIALIQYRALHTTLLGNSAKPCSKSVKNNMNTYCNFPIGMSAAVTAPLLLCRLLLDGTVQFDGKKNNNRKINFC